VALRSLPGSASADLPHGSEWSRAAKERAFVQNRRRNRRSPADAVVGTVCASMMGSGARSRSPLSRSGKRRSASSDPGLWRSTSMSGLPIGCTRSHVPRHSRGRLCTVNSGPSLRLCGSSKLPKPLELHWPSYPEAKVEVEETGVILHRSAPAAPRQEARRLWPEPIRTLLTPKSEFRSRVPLPRHPTIGIR
jgi:hypothetical protein